MRVLAISALTDKDRLDLAFALSLGVDWIGLSFVQRPEDVAEARALIGDRAAVMSKLEKPAAIRRLDEILALSNGVMVARGDLGVELPARGRARYPEADRPPLPRGRQAGGGSPPRCWKSMVSAPAPTRGRSLRCRHRRL